MHPAHASPSAFSAPAPASALVSAPSLLSSSIDLPTCSKTPSSVSTSSFCASSASGGGGAPRRSFSPDQYTSHHLSRRCCNATSELVYVTELSESESAEEDGGNSLAGGREAQSRARSSFDHEAAQSKRDLQDKKEEYDEAGVVRPRAVAGALSPSLARAPVDGTSAVTSLALLATPIRRHSQLSAASPTFTPRKTRSTLAQPVAPSSVSSPIKRIPSLLSSSHRNSPSAVSDADSSTLCTPHLDQDGSFDTSLESISFIYEQPPAVSLAFLRSGDQQSAGAVVDDKARGSGLISTTPETGDGLTEAAQPQGWLTMPAVPAPPPPPIDPPPPAWYSWREEATPATSSMARRSKEGKAIPTMTGPESLPYARNPSGVDGTVVDADGRLNIWQASLLDPEPEHVEHLHLQRRPGAFGVRVQDRNSASLAAYADPGVWRLHANGRPTREGILEFIRPHRLGMTAVYPPSHISISPAPRSTPPRLSPTAPAFLPIASSLASPPPNTLYHHTNPASTSPAFLDRLIAHAPVPSPSLPAFYTQPQPHPTFSLPYNLTPPASSSTSSFDPQLLYNHRLLSVASDLLGLRLGLGLPSPLLPVGGRQDLHIQQESEPQLQQLLLLSRAASSLRAASSPYPFPSAPMGPLLSDFSQRSVSASSVLSRPPPPSLPSESSSDLAGWSMLNDSERFGSPHLSPPTVASLPPPSSTATSPGVWGPPVDFHRPSREPSSTDELSAHQASVDDIDASAWPSRSHPNSISIPSFSRRHPDAASRSALVPLQRGGYHHPHLDDSSTFLPAGPAPGFAPQARRPGPRAGLPSRSMHDRAMDAMKEVALREKRSWANGTAAASSTSIRSRKMAGSSIAASAVAPRRKGSKPAQESSSHRNTAHLTLQNLGHMFGQASINVTGQGAGTSSSTRVSLTIEQQAAPTNWTPLSHSGSQQVSSKANKSTHQAARRRIKDV